MYIYRQRQFPCNRDIENAIKAAAASCSVAAGLGDTQAQPIELFQQLFSPLTTDSFVRGRFCGGVLTPACDALVHVSHNATMDCDLWLLNVFTSMQITVNLFHAMPPLCDASTVDLQLHTFLRKTIQVDGDSGVVSVQVPTWDDNQWFTFSHVDQTFQSHAGCVCLESIPTESSNH
ncbi:Aste57867_15824 [Aphanomyces stellatus]|uniref:Aste57867_15824 protein n=1 Tax=Aphanomyces stellatus TaxID=120398 RepID=A0A485L529_9STRA|nr:hypothetical protein As57867_015768 [Aphanomyces stellatus]VFT92612.1 Aste57867_15824 [Aphanomyces stellatus]